MKLTVNQISELINVPVAVLKWKLENELKLNPIKEFIFTSGNSKFVTEKGFTALISSGISTNYEAINNVYKLYFSSDSADLLVRAFEGLKNAFLINPDKAASFIDEFVFSSNQDEPGIKKVLVKNQDTEEECKKKKFRNQKKVLNITDPGVSAFSKIVKEEIEDIARKVELPFSVTIKKVYEVMRSCGYDIEEKKREVLLKYGLTEKDFVTSYRAIMEDKTGRDLMKDAVEEIRKDLPSYFKVGKTA